MFKFLVISAFCSAEYGRYNKAPFSMACLVLVYVCPISPVQSRIALQANLQILIYIVHDAFRLLNLHVNFFSIETKIVITSKIIL